MCDGLCTDRIRRQVMTPKRPFSENQQVPLMPRAPSASSLGHSVSAVHLRRTCLNWKRKNAQLFALHSARWHADAGTTTPTTAWQRRRVPAAQGWTERLSSQHRTSPQRRHHNNQLLSPDTTLGTQSGHANQLSCPASTFHLPATRARRRTTIGALHPRVQQRHHLTRRTGRGWRAGRPATGPPRCSW